MAPGKNWFMVPRLSVVDLSRLVWQTISYKSIRCSKGGNQLEPLWKTEDVAIYLAKETSWVRENVLRLGIPGRKVGRQWRFVPEQVRDWYDSQAA